MLDKEDAFNQPRFTPNIFATVVAADDFLLFKSLMVNKNVELELETRAFFLSAHRGEAERPARPSTASRLHRSGPVLTTSNYIQLHPTASLAHQASLITALPSCSACAGWCSSVLSVMSRIPHTCPPLSRVPSIGHEHHSPIACKRGEGWTLGSNGSGWERQAADTELTHVNCLH